MVARLRDSRVLAHIVAVLQSVRARAQFFEASLTPGVAFPPNFAPRIASQLLWRRFCRKFITRGLLWTQVYVAVASQVRDEWEREDRRNGRPGGEFVRLWDWPDDAGTRNGQDFPGCRFNRRLRNPLSFPSSSFESQWITQWIFYTGKTPKMGSWDMSQNQVRISMDFSMDFLT